MSFGLMSDLEQYVLLKKHNLQTINRKKKHLGAGKCVYPREPFKNHCGYFLPIYQWHMVIYSTCVHDIIPRHSLSIQELSLTPG